MADAFKTCSVDGCNGNAARAAEGRRGFCSKHYGRLKAHGDPLKILIVMHGMTKTRLYRIWHGMRVRCGHKRGCHARDAKNYRDKGIRVCQEWQKFRTFAGWANASGYTDNMTIDRLDSCRGYEPDNCRWVTIRDNNRARKNLKLSMDDAREIRRLRAAKVPVTTLAERYRVTRSYISAVIAGDKWAEE